MISSGVVLHHLHAMNWGWSSPYWDFHWPMNQPTQWNDRGFWTLLMFIFHAWSVTVSQGRKCICIVDACIWNNIVGKLVYNMQIYLILCDLYVCFILQITALTCWVEREKMCSGSCVWVCVRDVGPEKHLEILLQRSEGSVFKKNNFLPMMFFIGGDGAVNYGTCLPFLWKTKLAIGQAPNRWRSNQAAQECAMDPESLLFQYLHEHLGWKVLDHVDVFCNS